MNDLEKELVRKKALLAKMEVTDYTKVSKTYIAVPKEEAEWAKSVGAMWDDKANSRYYNSSENEVEEHPLAGYRPEYYVKLTQRVPDEQRTALAEVGVHNMCINGVWGLYVRVCEENAPTIEYLTGKGLL